MLALYESARLDQPVELPMTNQGDVIGKLYPAPRARSSDAAPVRPAPRRLPPPLVRVGGWRWMAAAVPYPGGSRREPSIGTAELANLTRVILSRNLSCTGGRMVPALEKGVCPVLRQPARGRFDVRHRRDPRGPRQPWT